MSENETDNNKNKVIESEVVQRLEEEQTEESVKPIQTKLNKKSPFMGSLTFVLSLTALAISGYVFYLQYYTAPDTNGNEELKSSVLNLENNTEKQISQLNQLLTKVQQENNELSAQFKALQAQIEQGITNSEDSNSSGEPATQTAEVFDDSLIKQQINDLEGKLTVQDKLIEQLQTGLNNSNSQNSQSLQQLSLELKSQLASQTSTLPVLPESDNSKSLAKSLLQEAYRQLNINGNVARTQELLSKTTKQLSNLTGLRYGHLANELKKFSQQLDNIEQPDVGSLKAKINDLSEQTGLLNFVQAEDVRQKSNDSSWYKNLISIKKIDQNQSPKLSMSEQITIKNVISNHYQMLQLALMSSNQQLWLSEIEQLQSLLNLHFTDSAQEINTQLTELQGIGINPKLPDLEPYLQKLNAINSTNENE
ncbi:MAG: uroporphyrinogen-III C-methyltransferase [Proteobacteria bacterium]|nr:uroporphyrinogen-III C-methyltransferase [Pseudomonadota bacterium]